MNWITKSDHPQEVIAGPIASYVARKETLASRSACRLRKIGFRLIHLLFVLLLIFSFSAAALATTPQDLLAVGRVDQAVQTLERQIQSAPSAESYNLLCRAHFELGDWDGGIPACEKAVELAPRNGLYHLWLGRIYGEKAGHAGVFSAAGLARKVRTEFERAVEFAPNSWEARTDLAEFYLEAPGIVGGGKDKARAQAELLVPLNPARAHWVKARLAQKDKNFGLAEEEYRAAVEASHGGARAWVDLAGFYRHTSRFEDMEQALRTAESSPLDYPGALVDGANILVSSGRDSPLAFRLLRRYMASTTVEEAPVFWARFLLGKLFENQGDAAAAADQYRSALAMAHNYRLAEDGLKRVTR